MQYIYENNTNENLLSQCDNGYYNAPTQLPSRPFQSHFQYQHETHSFSPQQSSTSDVDEVSPTSQPSLSSSLNNRTNDMVPSKIVKKKKQTKKKRKDPNEPQKPVSPYALFFRDTQNDIKKKLANPSFGEISKVVAHMWENIEPEVKEQYKSKAAAAKKEYLKQLAAYRAVQISNQAPTMHHLLNQTSLPFDPNSMQHHHKQYHSFQSYAPPSSSTTSIQQQKPQYNYFHYPNSYSHDTSSVYHADHHPYFSNSSHQVYSSYDSNNNYSDYQQYGLLRPAIESEQMKTHENLIHNINNHTPIAHYTDLSSMTTNGPMEKHYDSMNNVHWNQTPCLTTQW